MANPGSIDQWVEDEINAYFTVPVVGQTKRYRAYCKVIVNGTDVTDRLNPYLLSVTVHNGGVWTAQIELDDRDGRLAIPPLDSQLEIWLGWTSENSYRQFNGPISDVSHGFGRRMGGRRLFIEAHGWKQSSKIKSPINDHVGEGAPPGQMEGTKIPMLDAFQQFMGRAGLNVQMGASMQEHQRDYWAMINESPLHFAARMADEVGAWHRFEGDTLVFNGPNDFSALPLMAVWGNNLISWRVKPYAARPLWSGSNQDFFDHVKGMWNNLQKQFDLPTPWGGTWADAITKLPIPAPNSSVAQQNNDGAQEKADANSGFGRIIINGEPQAVFGSICTMQGARPGVDGQYFVTDAIHTYSRQGYVTTLEVMPNAGGSSTSSIGSQGYENTISQQYLNDVAALSAVNTGQAQSVNQPDGSVITFFPDGSQQVKNAVGTTLNPPT